MNTKFFVLLLIGIFAVGATMIVYNSQAATEREGRMYGDTNCHSGKNPDNNRSQAKAWGMLGVTFKNAGYVKTDYARGSGTINLSCGGNNPPPYNVDVSCRAIDPWWGGLQPKHYPKEKSITCAAPANVSANVSGTAKKGGHVLNPQPSCTE